MSNPHEDRRPDLPVLGASSPSPARVGSSELTPSDKPVVAVLSDVRREGRWPVPERMNLVGVMGDVRLDFREAVLPGAPVEIRSTTVMSDLTIIVPPGSRVRLEGLNVLGDQRTYEPSPGTGGAVQDTVLDLTVIVPPGSQVRLEGFNLLGDHKMHESAAAPSGVQDAVLDLTIRANGLMGDAKVYTLAPGEQIPAWWRRKG